MKFAPLSLSLAVAAAAAIDSACAQLNGLSGCAKNCLVTSLAGSGCPPTDTGCLCASTAFRDAVASCLESNCTAYDIKDVLAFEAAACGRAAK